MRMGAIAEVPSLLVKYRRRLMVKRLAVADIGLDTVNPRRYAAAGIHAGYCNAGSLPARTFFAALRPQVILPYRWPSGAGGAPRERAARTGSAVAGGKTCNNSGPVCPHLSVDGTGGGEL